MFPGKLRVLRLASFTAASFVLAPQSQAEYPAVQAPGLMPSGTLAVVTVNGFNQCAAGVMAFADAIGAPTDEFDAASRAIEMINMEGVLDPANSGLDLDREFILFLSGEGIAGAVAPLADGEPVVHSLNAEAVSTSDMNGETIYLLGAPGDADAPPQVHAAALMRGESLITSTDEGALRAMISPHEPPALSGAIAQPDVGEIAVAIDLDSIITTYRPMIDQMLGMAQMMMAQNQQAPDAAFGMAMAMVRGAVQVASEIDTVEVSFRADQEAVVIDTQAALRAGSALLASLPRHVHNDTALSGRLPGDPFVVLSSSFDAERGARALADFSRWYVNAIAPAGSEPALADRIAQMCQDLYATLGDQIAYGIYPGEGIMPGVAIAMRAPDPAAALAQMRAMMSDESLTSHMGVLYGLPASAEVTIVDLGSQEVGGVPAHHIQLTGLGDMVQAMAPASGEEAAVMQSVAEQLGVIDYWMASDAENLYMTTEPQPVLLARMLGGASAPLTVPSLASGVTGGADLIMKISVGGALRWASNAMPLPAPPEITTLAEALSQSETGIWAGATIIENGVRFGLAVPAADVARIVEMAGTEPAPPGN